MQASHRPISVYLLMVALGFQGLSGLAGGLGLIIDPSGAMIGLPAAWLEGSLFRDYLIPGVILFPSSVWFRCSSSGASWSNAVGLEVRRCGLALLSLSGSQLR